MSTYTYQARDAGGALREGKVRAASEAAVAERLRELGFTPLAIGESGQGLNKEISLPWAKHVKLGELAVSVRQLATMVSAGLPLLRGLRIVAEQAENPELRRVLGVVRSQVESGHPLSTAFAGEPRVFNPLMVDMVRAGETGGFLEESLTQIAETFEAEVRLRAKVRSAMTYPTVVLIMAILMCTGMLLFIVPIFEKMFSDLGGTLPLPTRILVVLSHAMVWIVPVVVVLAIGFVVAWRRWGHERRVREVVDPLMLRLPVFGGLIGKIALARFTRNLGTLLGAGVPVLSALDIVGDTSGSTVIAKAVADVRRSVASGSSVAGPLAKHPVFPSMVVQMIASGEEAGALDDMLARVAASYDEQVETTTEALTSLIEPLMIAGLGMVVGGMIVALYLPIFSVFDLIK
ncbi:type II secretion system F family protein [Nocardioides sp. GY 10127]|uniref:type II secretion system F family protein n=1 Tax=Nocardioides sp. GY 10127 TaxID=2569762 RepID=UPI0010A7A980|nr:type II secretion system F family protein [Nocardioides sp. GY 10127]TIC78912.1 type II secretion system F family protein [Nocardioides sp. GY 10127]